MPFWYVYECPHCPATKTLRRTVAERDSPLLCYHGDRAFEEGGTPSRMRRVIVSPPFHLKGKGWAKDGYQ